MRTDCKTLHVKSTPATPSVSPSHHSPMKRQRWCHCGATSGVTPTEQRGSGGSGGGEVWRGYRWGSSGVIGWDRLLLRGPTPLGITLLPIVSVSHLELFSFLWLFSLFTFGLNNSNTYPFLQFVSSKHIHGFEDTNWRKSSQDMVAYLQNM